MTTQHPAAEQIAKALHQFCLAHPSVEECPACKVRLREVLAIIETGPESSARTEYAVRYTERLGEPPTIDVYRTDPTDTRRPGQTLATVRAWQARHGLPADAEIVTRTVTTTDWQSRQGAAS